MTAAEIRAIQQEARNAARSGELWACPFLYGSPAGQAWCLAWKREVERIDQERRNAGPLGAATGDAGTGA